MKKRYRQMIKTRRLYNLEQKMYDDRVFSHITHQRSLHMLKTFAKFIWRNEKFACNLPEIKFTSTDRSWCDGLVLELTSSQRDILTLIHELVHAIGYDHHDEAFAEMELYLLIKYTPIEARYLFEAFKPIVMFGG